MGCSNSKLDDQEAVQLCKDRKRFIKQAVEQRTRFAAGHIAYIQSLKRVSAALLDYVEVDESHEFSLDSFVTPPITPLKKTDLAVSLSPAKIQSEPNSTLKLSYQRSGGNPAVTVEERLQSAETVRLETYSSVHHFGVDGLFSMQSSPINPSFFSTSPNNKPSFPPPSPQNSQWDFFWNPFTFLESYGYPNGSRLDRSIMNFEMQGLGQVREEEEPVQKVKDAEEKAKVDSSCIKDEVIVEEKAKGDENEHEVKGLEPDCNASIGAEQGPNAGQVKVCNPETSVDDQEVKEETPGYTVYVDRRPMSMAKVIKDLETQFTSIFKVANEVSSLLEANRAQYSSTLNEITAMKMLNPVALFRSSSSRIYESNSDFSDESCLFSGSHQSTLDRLYEWEKKLYEEVRSGERVRIAYEKKCIQLKNLDPKGEDLSALDKVRAAARDMHTQIKVSMHSIEAISKRIETLRDEELQPQLFELVQGLARMWTVMAECHQSQKRTLEEAKLLLPDTRSNSKKQHSMSVTEPHQLAFSAANLETELRNWRSCFELWITSQRSYLNALTGWLLLCIRADPNLSKLSLSPRQSSGVYPIFGLCLQWSRFHETVNEIPVLNGLDFFAAGMGSLYAQQLREDNRRTQLGSKRFEPDLPNESRRNMEVGNAEAEKKDEVGIKVLCAGMSVAMSSLTEFAIENAEGYLQLVKQYGNANWPVI